jgi:5-methylcytosine-specific restriction endonuclease McrA
MMVYARFLAGNLRRINNGPKGERRRRLLALLSEQQNHRCCYCGIRAEILNRRSQGHTVPPRWHATIEHIVSLAAGGSNAWENLAMACYWCNNLRGLRDALAFYESRAWEAAQAARSRANFPPWVRRLGLPWPQMVEIWPRAVGR